MRLPDFIMIGAAKSGTTTIYHYLIQHPQIFMTTPKEPCFFARDGIYSNGVTWYSYLFNEALDEQVCGEASTNYTYFPTYPDSAKRISQAVPRAKLIYIMRHPIDRAQSHYQQNLKNARQFNPDIKVQESFEEAIKTDSAIIGGSQYIIQIEQYLKYFPKEQILFLFMDELKHNPLDIMSKIYTFLNIDSTLGSSEKLKSNVTNLDNYWLIRDKLMQKLRNIPVINVLGKKAPKPLRDMVYFVLSKSTQRKHIEAEYIPQAMSKETRNKLIEHFKPYNKKLEDFLNIDLSHWNS